MSRFFDPDFYRSQPNVKLRSGQKPFNHFIKNGINLGIRPHPNFSAEFYKSLCPELVQPEHFKQIKGGLPKLVQPNTPILIFLHLPKTAGTSFIQTMFSQFRKGEIVMLHGGRQLAADNPEPDFLRSLHVLERTTLRAIVGHMSFGAHTLVKRKCNYLTLLRNPVDRIVSYYGQQSRGPRSEFYDRIRKNKMTLYDFVSSDIDEQTTNHMVRLIAGPYLAGPYLAGPYLGERELQDPLKKALSNISEHFNLVGTQEYFSRFLLAVTFALGWKDYRPFKLNTFNHSKYRPIKVSPRTRKLIEKRNELDFALFERFQKKMWIRLDRF